MLGKKICGNKEGRKRRRGRTTNVFFRECGNPLSIPQSTFSISGKYMEFYLMIYHLSGNNFFKDINILGGSTLVRQFTHHYSPEKKFGSQNKRRDIDVWKEKVIQKRSTLGKIVIFAFVLDNTFIPLTGYSTGSSSTYEEHRYLIITSWKQFILQISLGSHYTPGAPV